MTAKTGWLRVSPPPAPAPVLSFPFPLDLPISPSPPPLLCAGPASFTGSVSETLRPQHRWSKWGGEAQSRDSDRDGAATESFLHFWFLLPHRNAIVCSDLISLES